MKVAVLFGSFNPLTNAHVAAMKTVVEHINADKGLFVATNGQYLRKKTVKRGDPFYLIEEEISFRAADGGFTPEGEAIMLNKIRTIFRMGVEHGKDSLILGAFGCGAFKLPSADVVRQFRQVMNEPEFAGKFRLLVFAILESTRKPNGLNGKFADFYREFGTYHLT